jgi:hypothetical protein
MNFVLADLRKLHSVIFAFVKVFEIFIDFSLH